MKQLVMGTAGHIDHGKTSLVKTLTGINTDRLKEEKKRGITIELGFAWLDFPNDLHIGIVDVPGHEKFVRTMVAGAGGIDFVCLVIAADEGVMPQTREHFDICRMLNIEHGLVALTKTDMVDPEWLSLVTDDLEEYLKGTFLENAPIVPVSSTTGQGKEEILVAIESLAKNIKDKAAADLFRLPIDRVFTIKGFGTVITGTCVGGSVSVGQTVEILPSKITSRVRGLQVHGKTTEKSGAGLRTAVNFQGLDKSLVNRGEVLVFQDSFISTYLLDARIEYLNSAKKPLVHRQRIRFLHHTAEILGRIIPLSDQTIEPGESGFVQIRLEKPTVLVPGDRFVIRSYSPVITLGGGVVLHPSPKKHKRRPFENAIRDLEILESGNIDQKVLLIFESSGKSGLPFSTLPSLLGATGKQLLPVYRDLLNKGRILRYDTDNDKAISTKVFTSLKEELINFLKDFHIKSPTLEGASRKELAGKINYGIELKLLNKIISKLEKEKILKKAGDLVALAGHKGSLKGDFEKFGLRLLGAIIDGEYMPPTLKQLIELQGGDKNITRKVLDVLQRERKIVRISENLYYDKGALDDLLVKLKEHLAQKKEIDAQGFKGISKVSRKYSIPLLEYFDSIKVTLRVGDKRVLRSGG